MGLGTIIVICLIFGAVTAAIGQKKNLPVGQSFALGALLGIFGAIIVICQRPGLPKAPSGMRAVKCPRCNTIQNVPETQPEYVCWRCKAAHRLWGAAPSGN
jgi:DNA-directed RNA polymerase subunit RPC12/RpoP